MHPIFSSFKGLFSRVKGDFTGIFSSFSNRNTNELQKLSAKAVDKLDVSRKLSDKLNSLRDKLFSLKKPKSLDEYYRFGGFLLSKKLSMMLLVVVLIVCLWSMISVLLPKLKLMRGLNPTSGVKECYHDANSLKNYTGSVHVFSKKNGARYEGNLTGGVAGGLGTLYDENGKLLYRGNFLDNCFSGDGELYYGNGQVKYRGEFLSNLFSGEGTLYSENGKLSYVGAFLGGRKNGIGTLYDETGAEIYKNGAFYDDLPDLSTYLGIEADRLKDVFLGKTVIYNCADGILMSYPDLDCVIAADKEGNSVGMTQKVFIMHPSLYPGTDLSSNRLSLASSIGGNFLNGFTKLTPNELCVIDVMRQSGTHKFKAYEVVSKEEVSSLVFNIKQTSSQDEFYISKYKIGKFVYTFYFEALDKPYIFYSIERLS
ncbi:MAG: hypothetical protein LBB04_03165 [Oscillospiraceae bacterium]|jgi:hypothetical protein|nr:hypothetical protein [Oscillospiraceae bacterium]